jgi:hypothetical protein
VFAAMCVLEKEGNLEALRVDSKTDLAIKLFTHS